MSKKAENSDGGAEKRVRGIPFKKGVSGNPGGRPAVPADIKEMLTRFSPEAVQFQYDTMKNPKAPWPSRVKCSELLADRGLGKPQQNLNVQGDGAIMIIVQDDVEGV